MKVLPVPQSIDHQTLPGLLTNGPAIQTELLLDLFQQTAFARHGLDRSTFRVRHEQYREVIDECERLGYIRRENNSYFISLLGVSEVGGSPEAQQFFTNAESIYLYLQAAYRRKPNETVKVQEIAANENMEFGTVASCLTLMLDCNEWYCGFSPFTDPASASVVPSEGVLDSPSFAGCVARMRELRGGLAINLALKERFQAWNFDSGLGSTFDAVAIPPRKLIAPLPEKLAQLLAEVHVAIDNRLHTLVSMGLRALIDTVILDKVGDAGTFKEKLKALQGAGYIATHQLNTLAAAIDAGNASAHRGFTPQEQDIATLQEIVEHLLQSVYVHPEKAKVLAGRTPKRIGA